MNRFLAVCLNPTFQRTIQLAELTPGEVNRSHASRLDASGKGINVSRVLGQLGANVVHLTHLGPGRERFLELCDADTISVRWVESKSPIRTCTTLLDESSSDTTEIVEPTEPVDEACVDRLVAAFENELLTSSMVILSGSKAPGYPDRLFAEFCGRARRQDVPVVADYRGPELAASLAEHPRVIKINLTEYCATFLPECEVSESDDSGALPLVEAHIRELSSTGVDVVITRGSREVLWASEGRLGRVAVPAITPVNTIGSGDAVAAGMAHALAGGADLESAVRAGIDCGSRNALGPKPGSIL